MFKIGILGASGYTGAELIRLLHAHPKIHIAALTSERQAGKKIGEVFSSLADLPYEPLVRIDDVKWGQLDGIFCCLPHGNAQTVIRDLPEHLKIIDLSADYRLADPALYERTYGHPHGAPELQKAAIYGLTEHRRREITKARLVANPGCYPTAAQLPLLPLLLHKLIESHSIIIDAASGISGAGREVKQSSLFAEVSENFSAYGIAQHRHAPEIEQELSRVAKEQIRVSFTPHLVPMIRGILETIYVKLAPNVAPDDLRDALRETYKGEAFVHLRQQAPQTRDVRGTNHCLLSVHEDRRKGHAILVAAIDNLVKGAAGQAIQNLNVMMGWEETLGLPIMPLNP